MGYYFTSESVGVGHPDKIADRISDVLLDECLRQDNNSHVAIETMVCKNLVICAGEINTKANLNYELLIRNTIKNIGYIGIDDDFDSDKVKIILNISKQSEDINQGVDKEDQGAGDQGIMFGYACNETDSYIPITLDLSHKLVKKAKEVRDNKEIKGINVDCKSQVCFYYEDNLPLYIDSVVFSIHHSASKDLNELKQEIKNKIILPVCKEYINDKTKIFINPTGRFVKGGPCADTGLTGRKIIVDSYGGVSRHGGGCFSGKDPSKVDRSGAYIARYIAKNIVASGICDKCEIQISYAIGYSKPLSVYLDTFNTEKISKEKILEIINKLFDLTPSGIIKTLNLKNPIYEPTSFFGHFGRDSYDNYFPWERLDMVEKIKVLI